MNVSVDVNQKFLTWLESVAAILGVKGPHFPEWGGVTYKAVTPQFWRHVDVTFSALYTGYGRRRLSLIKFCFDLGPPTLILSRI